ncbi:chemotaxis protein CheW [Bacillus carboniphilus]|uniref:Chemotaxis protein CheW n=1 Tax=Bacillus carboniphilus TaxID=86663 RepID=A0ABY9JWU4_9BACI|nr:chemotaxis protein CheW [Bacillus carboniphilus]WLR43856.1 chemotaxis protein CheW [Bacillus carboniphilus]
MEKAIVFFSGDEKYALSIDDIVTIENSLQVVSGANFPSFIRGITNMRNEVVPVIDINVVFNKEKIDDANQKIIVSKMNQHELIGLLVEETRDIISVTNDMVKPLNKNLFQSVPYFTDIILHDDSLITHLNVSNLVDSLPHFAEVKEQLLEVTIN